MKICVLVVTYNRVTELVNSLKCYEKQESFFDYLIIVNNASTDGTQLFLSDWEAKPSSYKKIVVTSEFNSGGAGGFYLGIKSSLTLDYDFIFLADDDAFADVDMFVNIENFYMKYNESLNIVGMCTSVINQGRIDTMHRRIVKKGFFDIKQEYIDIGEYDKSYFKVDEISFVGTLISKQVIKKIGLPIKEYFIYYDDTEYSARIRKEGDIYCIPSAKMIHNTSFSSDISWKEYYVLRNALDVRKIHYGKKSYYSYLIIQYIKKCSVLSKYIMGRTKKQRDMYKKAIYDSITNNIKIDCLYYPGVKI